MKVSLYQIESQYLELVGKIIESEGVLDEQTEIELAINKEQLEIKGACYGFIVKDIEAEVDAIDNEVKRLQAMKSSRNKTIDRLKDSLKNAMQIFEVTEIKTPLIKINFRKSESVIVDEGKLDKMYMIEKFTYTPDKAMIKEAIKRGEEIEGASIQQNQNLQIK